jgi:tRNA (cytidine32/uridine32-2'-O)-methyltransferase
MEQTHVDISFLDPAAPRQLMKRLRRLYNRIQIDEMELNILRGILTETQKVAHELSALKTRSATQGNEQ